MSNYTAGQKVYRCELNEHPALFTMSEYEMEFVELMNFEGTLMVRTNDGIYFPHEVYAHPVDPDSVVTIAEQQGDIDAMMEIINE